MLVLVSLCNFNKATCLPCTPESLSLIFSMENFFSYRVCNPPHSRSSLGIMHPARSRPALISQRSHTWRCCTSCEPQLASHELLLDGVQPSSWSSPWKPKWTKKTVSTEALPKFTLELITRECIVFIHQLFFRVSCVELTAFVPGLEPIDRALSSVDGRSRQHRRLEL